MSDPVSALMGQHAEGFASIREIGPLGMITLRCNLSDATLKRALKPMGLTVPAPRRILCKGANSVGWMAPDELLLILPYSEVHDTLISVRKILSKIHFLAENVSDARAVFRIEGPMANQVLAKLSPVDLQKLDTDELRRTRVAQVGAAFWKEDNGYTLLCFRSVAAYVMGLLKHSAQPGSELS